MIEKVNPSHPDKIADRIAGAIVDYAYSLDNNVKIAVEVLIGHNQCTIMYESSTTISDDVINDIVTRITHNQSIEIRVYPNKQDAILAHNQDKEIRCGDNGIFLGLPTSDEEQELSNIAHILYETYPADGKYIMTEDSVTICQSNASEMKIFDTIRRYFDTDDYIYIVNPLGEWTGGVNVDCGATNRKLGSDMGHSITGGGLHGKDLSKADVSVNIWCYLMAQKTGDRVEAWCSIGDENVKVKIGPAVTYMEVPFTHMVKVAKNYIDTVGGFEKFAEWGLF